MNKAHVFQHKYTGVQIFVYHGKDELNAKSKFYQLIKNPDNWVYIGQKVTTNV